MQKLLSVLLSAALFAAPQAFASSKKKKTALKKMTPDVSWSMSFLKKKGFKKSFRTTLKQSYDRKSFEQVMRLNHLGFLAPPNHMSLVSDQAVSKSLKFIENNKKALKASAKTYQVPEEVISALLWVETRHGGITGKFHVPSVYMHLIQASRKKNQMALLKIAKTNPNSKKYTDTELFKIIETRSEWRANWALEQLQALEKMHLDKQKNLKVLKGSFAGAFGIPQFIPSSYRDFSASANSKKQPNLFKKADAVHSVAKYLNIHGWDTKNKETHIEALMKYNNSRDYAESIIDLSEKIRKKAQQKKDQQLAQQKDPTS